MVAHESGVTLWRGKPTSPGAPLKFISPVTVSSERIEKSIEEFKKKRSHPEYRVIVANPAGKEIERKKAIKDQKTMEEDIKRKRVESIKKEFNEMIRKK
jgi:hypothetical protein